jgi:hypothetical protein
MQVERGLMGEPSLRRPKRYLFQRADVRIQAHTRDARVMTFALTLSAWQNPPVTMQS